MIKKFLKNRLLLIVFLTFYLIFCLLTYQHYGISFDENKTYLWGQWLYMKVRGNDQVFQKDFVILQEGTDMVFYNNIYPAFLYAINGKDNYEIYHLLNMLFGSFLFIFSYEMLLKYYKKDIFAILGPIFLFFTPSLLGHIPSNPKDFPFALSYFVSLSLIFISEKKDRMFKALLLGLSFGLTQSLRLIGYSIYIVYIAYTLLKYLSRKETLKRYLEFFLEVIVIALIGYLVNVVTLPYLGADPFNHFIDLIKVSEKFPWTGDLVLLGKTYDAQNIPWFYLPTWFLVTTPLFILILFVFGLISVTKKNNLQTLLSISLFINIFIFFLIKPVIYDGIRHMLYLFPIIVILSVIGLIFLYSKLRKNILRLGLVFLIVINILLVAREMLILHPYEYIYFNEIVGGLKGAYGKFDTEYWGESNREATLWIKNQVENLPVQKSVYVCGNSYSVMYYFSKNMTFENDYSKADYVVCWERFGDNKKIKAKIVYTVQREGIALVHVYHNEKKSESK